jgi:alpha-glucosidase
MPWDEGEAPNGFSSGRPWLPVKPEHSALNVASQNADPDSVLNFYRLALAFRKGHSALVDGDIEFFKVSEPVLAFRRANKDESLVCIYNLSAETQQVKVEGDADIGLAQGIERLKGKLTLHANGWAIFTEHSDNPLRIEFKRRAKKPSN